jgi:hypothetical protein
MKMQSLGGGSTENCNSREPVGQIGWHRLPCLRARVAGYIDVARFHMVSTSAVLNWRRERDSNPRYP